MGLLEGSAFITGGASGIGLATAHAFAEHGIAKLALLDTNHDDLTKAAAAIKAAHPHVQILPLKADVCKADDVTAALSQVASQFGRLDVAVNGAGISGRFEMTHDMAEERWARTMNVNVNGVFRCQKAEIALMLKQEDLGYKRGRGSIINIASIYGVSGSNFPNADYTASKHAVVGLTRGDAQTYAGENIRINAICPGFTVTPMLGPAEGLGEPGNWLHDHVMHNPLRRLAKTEEVANAIVFLASSLSSYVHGHALVVDGGYTCG